PASKLMPKFWLLMILLPTAVTACAAVELTSRPLLPAPVIVFLDTAMSCAVSRIATPSKFGFLIVFVATVSLLELAPMKIDELPLVGSAAVLVIVLWMILELFTVDRNATSLPSSCENVLYEMTNPLSAPDCGLSRIPSLSLLVN